MRSFLVAVLLAGVLIPARAEAGPPPSVERSVLFTAASTEPDRAALLMRLGARVTGSIPALGLVRAELPLVSLEVLTASPLVAAIEAPKTLTVMGRPNDPLVGLQWALSAVGAFKAWDLPKAKAATKVDVAVIDTGIDSTHVDLEGRVQPGYDFLELDDEPYDDNGHGTHVSGIIAANTSNGKGIAGLSRSARIIPIKACSAEGACPIFATYMGVVDAVQRGAKVINMSLGGAGSCSLIDQVVYDYAREQGVLVVVAAGNSGGDDNPTITPASCNYTIGVGAIDQKERRAPFSSYGSFVDIAAPGVQVWSTMPPLLTLLSPYLGYLPNSGTSMASPFVAAAAGSLVSRHPSWTPEQVEQRLLRSARDAGKRGRDDFFGAGILDLPAAFR